MKLSTTMKTALGDIVDGTPEQVKKPTMTALHKRGLVGTAGELTEAGLTMAQQLFPNLYKPGFQLVRPMVVSGTNGVRKLEVGTLLPLVEDRTGKGGELSRRMPYTVFHEVVGEFWLGRGHTKVRMNPDTGNLLSGWSDEAQE
jgi:hypothetical protein